MSRSGSVTLDWGDSTYLFALKWGQLIELQEACDVGPFMMFRRFHDGAWRVQDISHVLRLGLIGGGMEPIKALRLVKTYVEGRPPMENLLFAQAVLGAAVIGSVDEQVPKKSEEAEDSESTTSPTPSSEWPSSSDLPPQ